MGRQSWIHHSTISSVLTPSDMASAMEYGTGLANSRLDIVQFDRPYLDRLYDESGDHYGRMTQRLKQVFPQHVAEIRTTCDNIHEIYESSAHEKAYDFSAGKIKKVNRWMNENKAQLKIGYDFFKRLMLENSVNEIQIPDLPRNDNNRMMTKTIIIKTCEPPKHNVVDTPHSTDVHISNHDISEENNTHYARSNDNNDDKGSVSVSCNNDSNACEFGSDEDSDSDWTIDDNDSIQSSDTNMSVDDLSFECIHCGRNFISEYHLREHTKAGVCQIIKHNNKTINARGLRILKQQLDNNDTTVSMQGSNVSHLMCLSTRCWPKDYFNSGWAQRPKHGKTKGHVYITADHKDTITKFFENGEKDKGMKMSAALMLEAMTENLESNHIDTHPHPKHYLPSLSEITVVINQLSTQKKNKKEKSMKS